MVINTVLDSTLPKGFRVAGILNLENKCCAGSPIVLLKSCYENGYYMCQCSCGKHPTSGKEKPGAALDEYMRTT